VISGMVVLLDFSATDLRELKARPVAVILVPYPYRYQ
jgi:hypothetical protein